MRKEGGWERVNSHRPWMPPRRFDGITCERASRSLVSRSGVCVYGHIVPEQRGCFYETGNDVAMTLLFAL